MEKINENNLYLKILKFWEKHPKWFTYDELRKSISLESWQDDMVRRYFYNAALNNKERNSVLHETMFIKIDIDMISDWIKSSHIPMHPDGDSENEKINREIWNSRFILKYDAYFNYIDYLELQKAIENSNEANEHAKNAKNLALWAIWIAIATWIMQSIIWIIQICITK